MLEKYTSRWCIYLAILLYAFLSLLCTHSPSVLIHLGLSSGQFASIIGRQPFTSIHLLAPLSLGDKGTLSRDCQTLFCNIFEHIHNVAGVVEFLAL
jgi:hypothetical protein